MTKDKPQATLHTAEIVREYGPFEDAPRINGVTWDGQQVWAATGSQLIAMDTASGVPTRRLDCIADGVRQSHLDQVAGVGGRFSRPVLEGAAEAVGRERFSALHPL